MCLIVWASISCSLKGFRPLETLLRRWRSIWMKSLALIIPTMLAVSVSHSGADARPCTGEGHTRASMFESLANAPRRRNESEETLRAGMSVLDVKANPVMHGMLPSAFTKYSHYSPKSNFIWGSTGTSHDLLLHSRNVGHSDPSWCSSTSPIPVSSKLGADDGPVRSDARVIATSGFSMAQG